MALDKIDRKILALLQKDATTPVARFAAVIVTPGMRAPLGSETVPPNFAFVVCAKSTVEARRLSSSWAAMQSVFMVSPPK